MHTKIRLCKVSKNNAKDLLQTIYFHSVWKKYSIWDSKTGVLAFVLTNRFTNDVVLGRNINLDLVYKI